MSGDSERDPVQQWVSIGVNVLAPVTVVTALLFYFGYASTHAEYEYFGVEVNTVGLSTQDYIMHSPQALLVPGLVLTLTPLVLIAADRRMHRLAATASQTSSRRFAPRGRTALIVGSGVLIVGIALMLSFPLLGNWAYFDFLVPLLIGTGASIIAAALHVSALLASANSRQLAHTAESTLDDALDVDSAATSSAPSTRGPTLLIATAVIAVVMSVFWATTTVAQWSGRGQARRLASRFNTLPR
jgi:hypothetical protein